MSYQIRYGAGKYPESGERSIGWMTGVCFAVFLLLVWGFWPEGREALQTMLWYGGGETALNAAEAFVESIQCGLSFADAAELFCIQVVSGAG